MPSQPLSHSRPLVPAAPPNSFPFISLNWNPWHLFSGFNQSPPSFCWAWGSHRVPFVFFLPYRVYQGYLASSLDLHLRYISLLYSFYDFQLMLHPELILGKPQPVRIIPESEQLHFFYYLYFSSVNFPFHFLQIDFVLIESTLGGVHLGKPARYSGVGPILHRFWWGLGRMLGYLVRVISEKYPEALLSQLQSPSRKLLVH